MTDYECASEDTQKHAVRLRLVETSSFRITPQSFEVETQFLTQL